MSEALSVSVCVCVCVYLSACPSVRLSVFPRASTRILLSKTVPFLAVFLSACPCISAVPDETLLEGLSEMALAEGNYWTSNSSHTFGVAKSTDDHLQCFLRETLPGHNFI
eukprot:SAG22_NODE_7556_length_729_cov_0.704762_2_plen_109_part_01